MEQIQNILKDIVKKGFLLDKESLDFFSKLDNAKICEDVLNRIAVLNKSRFISKSIITKYINEIKPFFVNFDNQKKKIVHDFFKDAEVVQVVKEEVKKDETKYIPNVKVLSSNIIPYKKIEVRDFISHFKSRYNFLKEILMERPDLTNLISIDKIGNSRDAAVIGLVSSKRITKNKNLLLEIEDLTGKITALINHDKEDLFEKAKEIVLDDVLAFKCSAGRDILYVNDVIFPDCHIPEKKNCLEEVYALFISDIHIGSNMFLEENFSRFLDWLNGIGCTEEQREKVRKVRYLFITGDSVDGVGIFPGQEEFLDIKNVEDQYKKLVSFLERVPKYINIIICPGQHDAVRVPEPQPPLDEEFAEPVTKLENVFLVTNPALIEIGGSNKSEGFKVLMYHGASMHGWVEEIEDLRVNNGHHNPAKIVEHLLKHRHLAPIHSLTTYVPDENNDPMIIRQVPDIITTGDLHKTDIDLYNNILIICSSCWQSITPFEEKVGNQPDPCKVPMLNLKTREIKIIDFSNDS